ncbi:MAG TPA: hypothetical protein VGK09_06900 [Rhodocyclaceae bacterium]
MRPALRFLLAGLITLPLLAGCDQLGIETPAQTQARQDAEGKAIGSACRQTDRALEECYARAQKDKKNKYITKASIFNGWKDMDAYMRENNLAALPQPPEPEPVPVPAAATEGEAADATNKDGKEGAELKPGEKPADAKPGSPAKPETKVDAPANNKLKANGKISANLGSVHYA